MNKVIEKNSIEGKVEHWMIILISLQMIFVTLVGCGKSENEDMPLVSKFYIDVTPNVELLADGQTVDLAISSNCSWSIKKSEEWLVVSPMTGTNSQSVSITAGKNETSESRVAVLTIVADNVPERKVTVTQPSVQVVETPQQEQVYISELYDYLRGVYGRVYSESQGLSSDEWIGVSFDGSYYDSGRYAQCSLHDFHSNNPAIGWYGTPLFGIERVNKYLTRTDQAPDLMAQARTLRAFFTWILMDSFGDTPIMDHVLTESEVVTRSPRPQVAQWIEKELRAVIEKLPTEVNSETYGKPTRYMAEALLAKLYINWPVYTAKTVTQYNAKNYKNEHLNDVVLLCDDIINSGKFSISEGANGYRSKFWPNNGPQIRDFIYVMPYDALYAPGMTYGRFRTFAWGFYLGERLRQSTADNFVLCPEFLLKLTGLSSDDRQENIIGDTVYMYDANTYAKTITPYRVKWPDLSYDETGQVVTCQRTIRLKYDDSLKGAQYIEYQDGVSNPALYPQECASLNVGKQEGFKGHYPGYRSVKYWVINDDYQNGRNQSNDLPIFRFADILLLKAEAIVRGANATNGQSAMTLFNQIRSYVNAPTLSYNPTLEDIYDERGREFFDENWRRNDMIRFGHFEDEYGFHRKGFPTARFDKECRIFPIPDDVLKDHPDWQQNAGY